MTLALLVALLAAQAVTPPIRPGGGDTLADNDPPIEMIDFLGRRRLCADAGRDAAERERLHCTALAGEERAWRSRFAGHARALRWLDQAPRDFRLERRFVATFDGPLRAWPRRTEQSGIDVEGRRYRLTIDTEADRGRSTRVVAAYDGWPERSFTLSNRLFPLIDLQSLSVGTSEPPFDRSLEVEVSYGDERTYCGTATDNRQKLVISFQQRRVRARHVLRTNCAYDYVRIEESAAR